MEKTWKHSLLRHWAVPLGCMLSGIGINAVVGDIIYSTAIAVWIALSTDVVSHLLEYMNVRWGK